METLKIDQKIKIDGDYYTVGISIENYYLVYNEVYNSHFFDKHELDEKQFVKNIVGYDPMPGYFPEVKSLEDLTKVVEAMLEYCGELPTTSDNSILIKCL